VVTQLRAVLPRRAYGTYYVDRIGNISTSHFRGGPKESVLEIKPRYPLYGGWKTDFTIGYDVPSQDLITLNEATRVHTLNLSFGTPFREPVADLLLTKIALPEGAYDVEIDCPFEFDEERRSRRYTYLDTVLFGGRPLITFLKRNVISIHNEYYQIRYKYDDFRVYYKLILLSGGVFSFFLFIIGILRINPSLDNEEEAQLRQRTLQKAPTAPSEELVDDIPKDFKSIIANISRDSPVKSIIEQLNEAKQKSTNKELIARIQSVVKKLKKEKDHSKLTKTLDDLDTFVAKLS